MKMYKINYSLIILLFSGFIAQAQLAFDEYYIPRTFETYPSSTTGSFSTNQTTVNISIDPTNVVNPISHALHGQNAACFNSRPDTTNQREQNWNNAEFSFLRWPGGNGSNIYFWDGNVPNTIHPEVSTGFWDATEPWMTNPDEFDELIEYTGAQPIVCVNMAYAFYEYESGIPMQTAAGYAADWMRDFIAKGKPVKYWELGNENYGSWTVANNIAGAEEYVAASKIFIDSMRSVDPTIQLGIVLTEFTSDNWNDIVLAGLADLVDYGIIHVYAHPKNNQDDISEEKVYLNVEEFEHKRDLVAQQLAAHSNKTIENFPIAITEYNARAGRRNLSRTNTLYTTLCLGEMARIGIQAAMQWDLQNGYSPDGGDHGLTSIRDPFLDWGDVNPEFYAHYYMRKYFGDTLVSSISNNEKVITYATTFSSGEMGLVIVNTSDQDQVAEIDLGSFNLGEKAFWHLVNGDQSDFDRTVYVNGVGPSRTFNSGQNYTSNFGSNENTEMATEFETNGVSGPQNYTSIMPREGQLTLGQNPKLDLPRYSVMYIAFEDLDGDCSIPNLGESKSLCGVDEVILETGLTNPSLSFTWKDGDNNIVGNASTLAVQLGGSYRVEVDNGSCVAGDQVMVSDEFPVVDFGNETHLCQTTSVVLETGVDNPNVQVTWFKDNELISNESSIVVYDAGEYEVMIIGDGCNTLVEAVTITSDLIQVKGDTVCEAGDDVFLEVLESGSFEWYDQEETGSVISSDAVLSETIYESKTYYVKDASAATYEFGLTGFADGASSWNNWNSASYSYSSRDMSITVYETVTLKSFDVIAVDDVEIVMSIGTNDFNFSVSKGTITLDVNLELTPGTYDIDLNGTVGPLVFQNSDIANNSVPGVVNFAGADDNDYGFFYNWVVATGGDCKRTPVLAVIDPNHGDCLITASERNVEGEKLALYPNPTTGLVRFSKEGNYKVIGTLGNVILEGNGNMVDLSSFSNGVYVLQLNGEMFRVVKQ